MYTQNDLDDAPVTGWPIEAVPRPWVEALFEKMATFYGVKFADQWRGTPLDKVQKSWGIELSKLTRPQWKAGVASLSAFPRPPTLPEFMAHCRQARTEEAARQAPALENLPRMTPEQAAEGIRKVHTAAANVSSGKGITAEWAFKLLLAGKQRCGLPLTHQGIKCASDAITSDAGRRVVETSNNPEYRALRQQIVDDYRMRGKPLWNVK